MSTKLFDACVAYVLDTGKNTGAAAFDRTKRVKQRTFQKTLAECYAVAFLDVFFKSKLAIIYIRLHSNTKLM